MTPGSLVNVMLNELKRQREQDWAGDIEIEYGNTACLSVHGRINLVALAEAILKAMHDDTPITLMMERADLAKRDKEYLLNKIERLRAALITAAQWMPVQPIDDAAKQDVAQVREALHSDVGGGGAAAGFTLSGGAGGGGASLLHARLVRNGTDNSIGEAVAAERERCVACLKECAADYANGDDWAVAVNLTTKAEAAIRKGE